MNLDISLALEGQSKQSRISVLNIVPVLCSPVLCCHRYFAVTGKKVNLVINLVARYFSGVWLCTSLVFGAKFSTVLNLVLKC